jgi:hypothetical protein
VTSEDIVGCVDVDASIAKLILAMLATVLSDQHYAFGGAGEGGDHLSCRRGRSTTIVSFSFDDNSSFLHIFADHDAFVGFV